MVQDLPLKISLRMSAPNNYYIPGVNAHSLDEIPENGYEYLKHQLTLDYKVGDLVKVARKAYSGEQGWASKWVKDMDNCVGNEYRIQKIDTLFVNAAKQFATSWGYLLGEENTPHSQWFWFPHFVLERSTSL